MTNDCSLTDSRNGSTISECVARESFNTSTQWCVIDDTALGIGTTSSRTRIDTFAVDASLLRRWTVGANNAFGPAVGH